MKNKKKFKIVNDVNISKYIFTNIALLLHKATQKYCKLTDY